VERDSGKTPALGGRSGLRPAQAFMGVVLLLAPAAALYQLREIVAPTLAVAIVIALSSAAFVGQWIDKRKAGSGEWRTPENILHLFELLGGWPGAYLAQRIFRHKTAKLSYQFVFWLIVAAYEYVAVDFLLGWKMAHHLRQLIGL